MHSSAAHLIESASTLIAYIRQPEQHQRVDVFVQSFVNFNSAVRQHVDKEPIADDVALRREIEEQLEVARGSSVQVLDHLRPAAVDPVHTQAISHATRQLADAVGRIVSTDSRREASWVQEADHALRQIEAVRPILQQSALAPMNENSYYESLEAVTEQAKRLGDGMSGMVRKLAELSNIPSLSDLHSKPTYLFQHTIYFTILGSFCSRRQRRPTCSRHPTGCRRRLWSK